MRKLATLLLCGVVAAPFAKADDQSVYIKDSEGQLSRYNVGDINYITFAPESDWLSLDADITENRNAYCDFIVKVDLRSDIKSLPTDYTVGIVLSHTDSSPTVNGGSCVNVVIGNAVGHYTPRLNGETEAIKKSEYWQTSVVNYARAYVTYLGMTVYSNPMIFTTPIDNGKTIYDVKWVDLQLPSGTLWASRNVGAKTEADSGNYYQWGSSVVFTTSDGGTKDNYPYWTQYEAGTDDVPTKYCPSDKETKISRTKNADGSKTDYDDAVEDWAYSVGTDQGNYYWQHMYMPTTAEFVELLDADNCYWTLTTKTDSNGNEVKGYLVKSLRNNEEIFLPFTHADEGKGFYWTCELNSDRINNESDWTYGNDLMITDSEKSIINTRRYLSFPVRGVYHPNEN